MNSVVNGVSSYHFPSAAQNTFGSFNRSYAAGMAAPGMSQRPSFGIQDLLGLSSMQATAAATTSHHHQSFSSPPHFLGDAQAANMSASYGYQQNFGSLSACAPTAAAPVGCMDQSAVDYASPTGYSTVSAAAAWRPGGFLCTPTHLSGSSPETQRGVFSDGSPGSLKSPSGLISPNSGETLILCVRSKAID